MELVKNVCVVGAGVAGLAFAYRLEQLTANCRVTVFENEAQVGGRTQTILRGTAKFDTGANYLTFDLLKQPAATEQFIRNEVGAGLVQIRKPVYLYDIEKGLRQGDRQSLRLAYKTGIASLSQQLAKKLKTTQIRLGQNVHGLQYAGGQWQVSIGTERQKFDVLVIAAPIPSVQGLLQDYCNAGTTLAQYSHQLTATYESNGGWPQYSSVLFSNHPITFVCCHEQKTASKVVNIQMNDEFSRAMWKSSDEDISEAVRKQLPECLQIKLGSCLHVAKWYPSLRINAKHEISDYSDKNLFFVGDSTIDKSRVVASLETGLMKADLVYGLLFK